MEFTDYFTPFISRNFNKSHNNTTWYYEDLNVEVTPGEKYYIMVDGYNNPGATGESYVGMSNVSLLPEKLCIIQR
jgi:hypothetical protein